MTISKDISKDKNKLTQHINKSVVGYIKEQIRLGKKEIETKELVNFVYNEIGYKDEILADNVVRKSINNELVKSLDLLENVNALSNNANLVTAFSSFVAEKKTSKNNDIRPLSIKKPLKYFISADFNKKINLLKTNELILNSGAVVFFTGEKDVKVIVAKTAKLNNVKECNKIFHYENIGDYIGCLDNVTNRVDLVATQVEPLKFFETQKVREFPVKKEIENLYYLINYSTEYKELFKPNIIKDKEIKSSLKIKPKPEFVNITSTDLVIK